MAANKLTPEEKKAKKRERQRAAAARWRTTHPEKARAAVARWRQSNRETALEYSRKYECENREKRRRKSLDYYYKNRDRLKKYALNYRNEHLAECRKKTLQWKKDNPEKLRRYLEAHPGLRPQIKRNRRAREKGALGTHTAVDIAHLFDIQAGKCAACKVELIKTGKGKYHIDHVMPLARGGSNNPENLQLLCPPCNKRKHSKHPDEWAREIGLSTD